jgi:zinc transport system permease protein
MGAPMDDFLARALLAGIGVAAVAGPLGSFVVWRRMAYFGDALSHSALLGVALGLLLGVAPVIGVAAVAVVAAVLFALSQRLQKLAGDTMLGILAHSTLAVGLVTLSFMPGVRVDLMAYLFGDVLAVTGADLYWIYGGGVGALVSLALIWRTLLASSVHEDLARVEGAPVGLARLAYMMLLAVTIAIAMKVVGVLLITSLLIIPAATARRFSRTPEAMALLAAFLGCAAVALGLLGSFRFDTPAGPTIVVAAALLFLVSALAPRILTRE